MDRQSALIHFALFALISSACRPPADRAPAARAPAKSVVAAGDVRSNILREDYAGSRACERCHAEIYRQWEQSPMHHMTRLPDSAVVNAPFNNAEFRFKEDSVHLETHDGQRYMRLESPQYASKLFRVTKVIGGHHREDFAGVEVDAQSPGLPPVGDAHAERVLPVSYMLNTHSFRYKGYSVMVHERPGIRPGGVWNKTCIFCHNTVPLFSTIFGALAGPDSKPYQGEVVDTLLPPDKRVAFEITDQAAFARAVDRELAVLGVKPSQHESPAARAVRATRARFNESHLLEVGIGCESCHGGAREHVAHVGVSPSLEPRAEFLKVQRQTPDSHAQRVNRVCARCHQVLFSQYPFTWEGGLRNANPGGSNINSGEARDSLLGRCAAECTNCHDPHAPDNQRRMADLEGEAGNKVCLKCHEQYSAPDALKMHTHHQADGAGSLCMNCHMVRKNMSLDSKLTRYHRIGSPTDAVKVERDRPLECALCHADRTVAQLVGDMERFWNKSYDRASLRALYGDLNQNALLATLKTGKPHELAAAMAAAGEHRMKEAAPLMAAQLTNEYPIIRFYARNGLSGALGKPIEIDVQQDDQKIEAAAAKLLTESGFNPIQSTKSKTDLHDSDGED